MVNSIEVTGDLEYPVVGFKKSSFQLCGHITKNLFDIATFFLQYLIQIVIHYILKPNLKSYTTF